MVQSVFRAILACVAGGFVGVLSGGAEKAIGEAARGMAKKNLKKHSRLRRLHFHRARAKPPATQAKLAFETLSRASIFLGFQVED